ncbi:MAG: di-heme oxidoredictase family protein [Cyanobacteria bacterium P01_F01_bin.33]
MLRVIRRRAKQRLLKLASLTLFPIIIGFVLSYIVHEPVSASSPSANAQAIAMADIPLAGGKTTSFIRSSHAYEQPSANLSDELIDFHGEGDVAFEAVFVTAPADVNPGLGPHFNNTSCVGCHIRNGRGLPTKGQMLVRVSQDESLVAEAQAVVAGNFQLEPVSPGDNTPPVPGLGTQIQDQGVYGAPPEGSVTVEWQETTGQYADGSTYTLREPITSIALADGSPLPDTVQTSLRTPPPVFGLGLFEAIPEKDILALADSDDKDGDGISGRPNYVWDEQKQSKALGMFGLKANQPNLLQQTASAYAGDMGVTNPIYPAADGSSDIDDQILNAATFYAQSLAVPARTLLNDPAAQRGEKLFSSANCAACHISTMTTGTHPEYDELSNQTIHAYTDLLLHDMGPGLADNRPDFEATGTEWRTQPLWGIGVAPTVLPYAKYLHDGRARTLEEAILWHGGEAEASKQAFVEMPEDDRKALVRFLRTL